MSKGLWTAAVDGITGLTVQVAGRLREGASDEFGRVWTRLFVNGAAVATGNPLPTTGGGAGGSELVAPIFFATDDSATTPELDWYDSAVLEGTAGINAKPSAGRVYEFDGFNDSNAVIYVGLYNKASAPVNTNTPIVTIRVPAGGSWSFFPPGGKFFSSGISFAASTVPGNLTLISSAAIRVTLGYK